MPAPVQLEVELAQSIATNATADADVSNTTYGADIFAGDEQEASPDGFTPSGGAVTIPHRAVFVLEADGLDADGTLDGQLQLRPIFDVMIRSDQGADKRVAGKDLADAIAKACNRRPPTGWVNCFVVGTHARYEGMDDQEHHRWLLRVVGEKQSKVGGT
jgi:hypothetical protein